MTPIASAPPLLQAADTVVMLQARDGLGTASAVADVVLAVMMILFVAGLTVLFFQLRRISRIVKRLGDRALEKADPIVDRGRGVADNVEFITMAVRDDVQKLNQSVRTLNDRLQQASDRMEERIEEFNALMEVVQSEAEDLFVGTAATARGVRAGVRSLSDDGSDPAVSPPGRRGRLGVGDLEAAQAGPGAAGGGIYVTGTGEGEDEEAGEPGRAPAGGEGR